jgi:tetratricopeptide (TPR) repeat protein
MGESEITHTFGFEPLQQYLVPFPGGRLQALWIAWDVEQLEWFHLYPESTIPPDDWLHWTRNGQNWNGMCAECHSTNLVKGYDADTQTFDTTWSEINVSCEACHGPGSRHVAWADLPPMARPEDPGYALVIATGGISSREQVELCAPCHSRRTELGDYDHTRAHLLDNHLPTLLREGLYHADGQILDEVYVYGSFVQSKMYHNDVRCSDCHDVHSLELREPGNELCLQCHRADAYDTADHHFHKKVHEGRPSEGALCVKCHMPEQPYMVIDWRADHSLRVPRPDLSAEIGSPDSCAQAGCHPDTSVQWRVDAYTRWYGQAKKPHYGSVLAAGREGVPGARDDLIRLAGDALFPTMVRATALSLLGAYPDAESLAALRRAVADDEALIRLTAVRSLEALGTGEAVELMAPLLDDPVTAVRLEAASRLAGIADERLKPYQRERLAEVLVEYRQAMEYSLDFAFAGYNLGNLNARLGDRAEAERFYRTAISIDELFFPAKSNLAVLLNSMGRNDEAETLLREILEAYPENYDTAYSLGLLVAEMGRLEEAALLLERAAEGLAERPRVFYNLGLVLQHLGRLDEARSALNRAVELEPENPVYLHALADHLLRRGEEGQARELIQLLVERHPAYQPGRQLEALLERGGGG